MEQKDLAVVMDYLRDDLVSIVETEIDECRTWLGDTYAMLRGTGDDNAKLKQMKSETELSKRNGEIALNWLKKDGVVNEYILKLLKKDYHYYVANLCPISQWYDFAVVGLMASWIHEYDECDTKMIETSVKGDWRGLENDYTVVPKDPKDAKAAMKLFMEDYFPHEMATRLRDTQTLSFIQEMSEQVDTYENSRDVEEVLAWMEMYIIDSCDWEEYWDLGEEDLRHEVYSMMYHEYRKLKGLPFNLEADVYSI